MPWVKYLSVVLASMVKFIGGPLAGLSLGLQWWETALLTLIGMMLSVVAFTFLGEGIQRLVGRYRRQKPRLFSRRTRLAVRVWRLSKMTGIALLTPLIFTPIGGTLLAVSFKVPRTTLLIQMAFWGAFWGVVLTLGVYFLGDLMP